MGTASTAGKFSGTTSFASPGAHGITSAGGGFRNRQRTRQVDMARPGRASAENVVQMIFLPFKHRPSAHLTPSSRMAVADTISRSSSDEKVLGSGRRIRRSGGVRLAAGRRARERQFKRFSTGVQGRLFGRMRQRQGQLRAQLRAVQVRCAIRAGLARRARPMRRAIQIALRRISAVGTPGNGLAGSLRRRGQAVRHGALFRPARSGAPAGYVTLLSRAAPVLCPQPSGGGHLFSRSCGRTARSGKS